MLVIAGVCAAVIVGGGCDGDALDAEVVDGGALDAEVVDGGALDAEVVDGGALDAEVVDGGCPLDGEAEDTGSADGDPPVRLIYTASAEVESPAITIKDVTGDDMKEMAVTSLDGRIHLFDADGNNLPGWPVDYPATEAPYVPEFNGISRSAPAIADLDGDGVDEIIVAGSFNVYAYNLDGTLRWSYQTLHDVSTNGFRASPVVADLDGDGDQEVLVTAYFSLEIITATGQAFGGDWPKTYWRIFAAPAVADLDGDGDQEIVVAASQEKDGRTKLVHEVWHHDGTNFGGDWPNKHDSVSDFITLSPMVADMDGDGALEIIAYAFPYVFVYTTYGRINAGWPCTEGGSMYLAVGDMDSDGFMEVAFGRADPYAYLYDHEGNRLWQRSDCISINSNSPTIGDVDGDNLADNVLADGVSLISPVKGRIWAINSFGHSVNGLPPIFNTLVRTSASLVDLDNDGLLEVVFGLLNGEIRAIELDVSYNAATMYWPQYLHDPQHTSFVP